LTPVEPVATAASAPPPALRATGDIYADWDIDQLAATMAEVLESAN
jgi:hypothetical protein